MIHYIHHTISSISHLLLSSFYRGKPEFPISSSALAHGIRTRISDILNFYKEGQFIESFSVQGPSTDPNAAYRFSIHLTFYQQAAAMYRLTYCSDHTILLERGTTPNRMPLLPDETPIFSELLETYHPYDDVLELPKPNISKERSIKITKKEQA